MKKLFYLIVFANSIAQGQTNSYPSSGNVKIFAADQSWAEGVLVVKPSTWGGLRIARNDPSGGNYNGNWAIGYSGSTGNDFSISTNYNGTQYDGLFHISNSTRNVGIGTTNPSSKLHVDGGHIYLGPLTGTLSGVGRLSVSGNTAEISLSNRAATSFVESPSLGERWVIYNEGTASDGKLRFWSGGDKAVITKEGNVGIGTTNPSAKLNIYNSGPTQVIVGNPSTGSGGFTSLSFGTSADVNGYGYLQSIKSSGTAFGDIILNKDGGNVGIGTTSPPTAKLDVNGTINAAGILINGAPFAGGGSQWATSGTDVYYNTSGSVGIGTSTPSQKLDVLGNFKFNDKAYFGNWILGASGQWPSNPGFAYAGNDETFGISSYYGQVSLQIDGAFRQQEAGKVNYFMDKVGIGTTSPDAMLTVSGQVHAQEVKVTVNAPGPDYVFEKDYKLSSLEEIKNYIDQNKHLPEVPSAKEMEKNGVQLGEMNMLLLKKIEELTLYVIELKNRAEAQQMEIEALKKSDK